MKGRLPNQTMALIVAANTFRYLFFGAARNWVRNIGSIAPALGSMTLLSANGAGPGWMFVVFPSNSHRNCRSGSRL